MKPISTSVRYELTIYVIGVEDAPKSIRNTINPIEILECFNDAQFQYQSFNLQNNASIELFLQFDMIYSTPHVNYISSEYLISSSSNNHNRPRVCVCVSGYLTRPYFMNFDIIMLMWFKTPFKFNFAF